MRKILNLTLIFTIIFWCFSVSNGNTEMELCEKRTFEVRYITHVTNVPEGAGILNLWIPVPQNNKYQNISNFNIESPFNYTLTEEKKYGNKMLFFSISIPPSEFDIEISFNVCRYENTPFYGREEADSDLIKTALQPNKLVPLSEEIRSLSMDIVQEKESIEDKARAFYDYILDKMEYDKSGTGWGRGDFYYACDAGKGNCTDFHSYFIGLCRNIDIPAYFEIGLLIPTVEEEGKTGGYHCWAYFEDNNKWIPVDISEADKDPDRKEYFFSNLCENRVTFSRGRDIILEPEQKGEPLNFFIYPYGELDGMVFENIGKDSFYKDIKI